MPRERLPMRKIRDVLRLHAGGLSKRRIAASLTIGRTAVGDYIRRAKRAGLGWPLAEGLADEDLDRLLFPPAPVVYPRGRPPADWPALHRELKRPGVTLSLLWEEYRAVHPDGYGYSQFCARYRAWKGKLDVTMRQSHVAGEKMFVDYAGATAEVIDPESGEVHEAQIFVATLGASSYTYAEATWTQGLPNWIGSHTRAFAYFDGVPAQVVPDNLKSGVVKACLYDPEINRTYADLAAHYDTAIVPARPRKPRDKAKVGVGVQLVERWNDAGRAIRRRRIDAMSIDVRLGTRDEEGPGLVQHIKAGKVDVATIHDVDGSGFRQEHIEGMNVVQLAIRDVDKTRNVAPQVEQRVHLHRRLGGAEVRPRKDRQAQSDGRRVQGVDGIGQVQPQFFVDVQRPRLGDEPLGQRRMDTPVAPFVGIGQRRTTQVPRS